MKGKPNGIKGTSKSKIQGLSQRTFSLEYPEASIKGQSEARNLSHCHSLKKRAEGYSIAQEPSFSLGAKNTIRARNCLGCAGDTGILLLLCKISTRLAREIERRLVKSKKKKKKVKNLSFDHLHMNSQNAVCNWY